MDVNWRPVFFKDPEAAPKMIKPYVEQADIVKVTEEEAEWLWGVPGDEALEDAEKVGRGGQAMLCDNRQLDGRRRCSCAATLARKLITVR